MNKELKIPKIFIPYANKKVKNHVRVHEYTEAYAMFFRKFDGEKIELDKEYLHKTFTTLCDYLLDLNLTLNGKKPFEQKLEEFNEFLSNLIFLDSRFSKPTLPFELNQQVGVFELVYTAVRYKQPEHLNNANLGILGPKYFPLKENSNKVAKPVRLKEYKDRYRLIITDKSNGLSKLVNKNAFDLVFYNLWALAEKNHRRINGKPFKNNELKIFSAYINKLIHNHPNFSPLPDIEIKKSYEFSLVTAGHASSLLDQSRTKEKQMKLKAKKKRKRQLNQASIALST